MLKQSLLRSLSNYSDSDFHLHLGIRNWSKRLPSYSELLYRHSSLSYEENGIYLLDKLSVLFKCAYHHPFFKNISKYSITATTPNRFRINDFITIVRLSNYDDTYFHSYSVEVENEFVGVMSMMKTTNRNQVKFHIDNEVLYTKSPMAVITILMTVATEFDLHFMNYNNYEIAFDSTENYLGKALRIYHRSDRCSAYECEAHGTAPIYRVKGSQRLIHETVDHKDNTKGTYTEGSKKSATQLKIYDKTYELRKNEKAYVSEIHLKHFGEDKSIYRVEVTGKSPVFYDNGILGGKDLVDLLNAENHSCHFRLMLGDKLQFRTIKPIGHNHNRNPIYEEIQIISKSITIAKIKVLPVKAVNQLTLHDKNINSFKQILNGFLDKRFDFNVVLNYIKNLDSQSKLNKVELITGIDLCLRRYQNPLMDKDLCRLENLKKYLTGNMNVLSKWLFLGKEWMNRFRSGFI